MRDGVPGPATVAADFAARGAVDDALVRAATAAQVGLVTVGRDGAVWWSDEAYRLHGRPRWRRIRSTDDLAWGLVDGPGVRRAYDGLLDDPDLELRYTAVGESGERRDLVLHALAPGVALVHRAAARTPDGSDASSARPGHPETDDVVVVLPAPVAPAPADPAPVDAAPDLGPTAVAPAPTDALADAPVTEPEDTAPAAAPAAAPPAGSADVVIEGSRSTEQQDRLAEAVLAATPDLVVVYDVVDAHVTSVHGTTDEELALVARLREGQLATDVIHEDDHPRLEAWREEIARLEEGDVAHVDLRLLVGDSWRWSELRATSFRRGAEGGVREIVVLVRDVDDRVESTLRLAESERAFREVFDMTPVGLAVLDDSGRFTDVNEAFCKLVGRTREAVLSTVYEALLHPQDRAAAVITRARRLTEGLKQSSGDARIMKADGSTVWVRVRSTEIDHHEGGRTLVSLDDVTRAKATEDQLRHDAMHDELTGLPNRRLMLDRLERALARSRRSGTRLAVFFIDLDDLKRVNDTHPWKHRAGDLLITSTASALRDALREADTLSRLGGDEFVAICEDLPDDTSVDDVGRRLLAAGTAPLTIGAVVLNPGVSIGVALSHDDEEDGETLLRRADSAMYRAKSSGGSLVVRADSDGRPVSTTLDVDDAVRRRELVQHYQPIVSLSTGAVLGVSTVVRRRSADDGAGGDTAIVPVRTTPVVQWSLAQAVMDVRTVAPTRVEHVSVWIPTSARAALADSTRETVAAALRGTDGFEGGDTAPSLVLDVHESEVGLLSNRVRQHLDDLLATGPLALGVHHFSADAVPLGRLQELSAASVSLDPSLLDDAARDAASAEVVHALVAAASALGVVTIAMGVDSQEQLDSARALGVHAVYGDLVGPPAPLDSYADLLHGGRITLPGPVPMALPDDQAPHDDAPHDDEVVSLDAWAQSMAARLAEPAAEGQRAEGQRADEPAAAPRAIQPEPVVAEPALPAVEAAPVVEPVIAQPTTEPVVPVVPVVEAAPVVDVPPAAAPPAVATPTGPVAPPAVPVAPPVIPVAPPAVPVAPPAAAAPASSQAQLPPHPLPPYDVGAALARELGIVLPGSEPSLGAALARELGIDWLDG